jgi:hypothetical protein
MFAEPIDAGEPENEPESELVGEPENEPVGEPENEPENELVGAAGPKQNPEN